MLGSEKFGTGLLYSSNKKQVMLTSGDTCVTLFFKACGMSNLSTSLLGTEETMHLHVVLLVPEGCTSSKLPARLDGEVSLKTRNAMLHVHRFT